MKLIIMTLTILILGFIAIPSQPAKAGLWFFEEETIDCLNHFQHWGTKVICVLDLTGSCTSEECTDPICNPPECGTGGGSGGGSVGVGCEDNCPTCGIGCDPWAV